MKAFLLLIIAVLAAVAEETEYDTEYGAFQPNVYEGEYVVPLENVAEIEYEEFAPIAYGIVPDFVPNEDDTMPEYEVFLPNEEYGEFAPNADNVFEEKNNSGWFIPAVDGSFYWMSKEQFEIEQNSSIALKKEYEIKYKLYVTDHSFQTLRPDNVDLLNKSIFNSENPTAFIIHGWRNRCTSPFCTKVLEAFFKSEIYKTYNIICLDWSDSAEHWWYPTVTGSVPGIAQRTAKFVDFLNAKGGMSFDNLTLIGFSLGAHLAGFVGKKVKNGKVHTIIGLDPAGPGYSYDEPKKRLAYNDAKIVQSIHTNSGNIFSLGFRQPIGSAAFYPNGGELQSPCKYDKEIACSHSMAYKYFAIAVLMDNFCAIKCKNYEDAQKRKCGWKYEGVRMAWPSRYPDEGVYYVPIITNYPYGMCYALLPE